ANHREISIPLLARKRGEGDMILELLKSVAFGCAPELYVPIRAGADQGPSISAELQIPEGRAVAEGHQRAARGEAPEPNSAVFAAGTQGAAIGGEGQP